MKKIACVVFALCAPVAYAHHGFGTFDMTKEIEITGTVTNLAFVNPHSWLYLDVTAADGKTRGDEAAKCVRQRRCAARAGYPELFPVGGQVTIKGSPDRNVPTACYVSTLVFADGSSLDRYGQRTPPVGADTGPRAARLANGNPNIAGLWAAEQIVMADPRGVNGALVPLSEAQAGARNAPRSCCTRPPLERRAAILAGGCFAAIHRARAADRGRPGRRDGRRRAAQSVHALRAHRHLAGLELRQSGQSHHAGRQDHQARVRQVRLRAHDSPRSERPSGEFQPSLTGHSIGRWENDVLVVHTVGVRAGTLTRGIRSQRSARAHGAFLAGSANAGAQARVRRRGLAVLSRAVSGIGRRPCRRTCRTSPTPATIARCSDWLTVHE